MCDLDGALNRLGLRERKLKMQIVADAKRALDLQPNPLFRQIDDLAGKGLIPASNDTGSDNRNTKELPLLGHG